MQGPWKNHMIKNSIYKGSIRHRRFLPGKRCFHYRFSMMYFDLDSAPALFRVPGLTACDKIALAQFNRRDFHGSKEIPLKQHILENVKSQLGIHCDGQVMVLTNLRILGWLMNPITLFYCYNLEEELVAVAIQVTNTPWREKVLYVLDPSENTSSSGKYHHFRFRKRMHVSPFNPMEMEYRCVINKPGDQLFIHLENLQQDQCHTDATLKLEAEDLNQKSAAISALLNPVLTLKVALEIYWNALLLMIRRNPIYDHPGKDQSAFDAVSQTNSR